MSTIIYACEMIRDEVVLALKNTGCNTPVIWVDNQLHTYPEKLRAYLQSAIDQTDNVDTSVFAFGLCGNAFIHITTGNARAVIPAFNDCTEMILCNQDKPTHNCGCYYLTRGWLSSEKSIKNEIEFYTRRYNEKNAYRIMKRMFANYQQLMLIDTGAYPVDEYLPEAEEIADALGLDLTVSKGTVAALERLFEGIGSGRWGTEFHVIPPHTEITYDHLGHGETINSLEAR